MFRNLWAVARMVIGSILGIVGFATVSEGFVHLSAGELMRGLAEILLGAFIALGVMAPLRKHQDQH